MRATWKLRSVVGPAAVVALLAGLFCLAAAVPPAVAQESDSPAAEREAPAPVERERRHGDLVSVFSGEIRVPAHVDQWGSVIAIGDDVVIEGRVRGQVVVIGGNLELSGYVGGDVIGVLSNVTARGAEIDDQLINVAGTLDKDPSTSVGEQLVDIGFGKGLRSLSQPFGVLGALLFWGRLLRLLLVFLLILLLVVVVPERIRAISAEVPHRLLPAFLVGILGYLAYWIVLVLLLATVVGVVLAWVLFVLMKWLAITGIFHFLGQRVGRALGREMSLLGAVLLGFAPYLLLVLVPSFLGLPGLILAVLLSVVIWLFLEVPAVGLVILTRAGGRASPAAAPAPPAAAPAAASAVGAEPPPPPAPEPIESAEEMSPTPDQDGASPSGSGERDPSG